MHRVPALGVVEIDPVQGGALRLEKFLEVGDVTGGPRRGRERQDSQGAFGRLSRMLDEQLVSARVQAEDPRADALVPHRERRRGRGVCWTMMSWAPWRWARVSSPT